MKRIMLLVLVVVLVLAFAAPAFAGEWNPNRGAWTPQGASACAFNGLDQPDVGDDPEDHYGFPGDDGLWGLTPANQKKVHVQTGGQIIAAGRHLGIVFEEPGVQGVACNPNTGGGGEH